MLVHIWYIFIYNKRPCRCRCYCRFPSVTLRLCRSQVRMQKWGGWVGRYHFVIVKKTWYKYVNREIKTVRFGNRWISSCIHSGWTDVMWWWTPEGSCFDVNRGKLKISTWNMLSMYETGEPARIVKFSKFYYIKCYWLLYIICNTQLENF